MNPKRLTALLLALLIAGMSAAACADSGSGGSSASTTASSSGESSAAEETELHYTAEVPEGTNYEGYTFTIHTYPAEGSGEYWYDRDFSSIEENGEIVNDASYQRRRITEEKLNIKIANVPNPSDGSALKKSVAADDGAYDIAFLSPRGSASLSQENILYNLKKMDTLDLSAAWWDQNAVNDMSINNMLFMVTGDIGIMYKMSIGILMFNKQMIEDYTLQNPYDMLDNHTWTIDAFTQMAQTVSEELDGNGKYDTNDRYGLLFFCNFIANGMIGSGVKFVTKDADDLPTLTFYSEKTVQIWEKYTTLFYDTQTCYSWSRSGGDTDAMFLDNRALFQYCELHSIEPLRQMDTDFGILPIPLYEESQERYYHCVNPHVAAMLTVPIYNRDFERTGYILDTLGAESKNVLTPAYYDIYLKTKGARDDQSEATIDIVLDSLTYDMGYIFNWGTIGQFTLSLVDSGKTDLTSSYSKIEKATIKQMDKAIDNYLNLMQ